MVGVVHMNIFYRMDLEICDSKSELWKKTEKKREVEKLEIQFRGPKFVCEAQRKALGGQTKFICASKKNGSPKNNILDAQKLVGTSKTLF